jgi:hypothetical protein
VAAAGTIDASVDVEGCEMPGAIVAFAIALFGILGMGAFLLYRSWTTRHAAPSVDERFERARESSSGPGRPRETPDQPA